MRNPSIIFAVAAMTVASSANAQSAFSDDQIRSALVGNTISGQESGEPYVEFLRPDGRIDGVGSDGRYTGHWVISRGRMCMSYDVDDGKATPGIARAWSLKAIESFGWIRAKSPIPR